ncbi:MAG TPA: type II secretion system protein [Phycisphaerae bacterium]|nr:type II secretion system protein [Phycisphaerae bacterium]HUT58275.1 type II secretion system protein [Phycisphaerae bacterium]
MTTWRGRAFTLVELLVVVAILMVLASILVPSLGRARALARQVYCQQHLKQWGLLFEMYASRSAGCYPHCDGLDRDNGPADRFGWVDVLPPLTGGRPWRDYPPWEKPGVGTFFQCCAASLAPDAHYSYNARRNGYFSYAMNSCLELDESCWRAPGDRGVAMPSFLKVERIMRPYQVVLLFDQLLKPELGYDGRLTCRSAGKHCGGYPKAFSARHAARRGELGGSILFCDSHVEWRQSVWKDDWPPNLEVPPRDDTNWFPYPPQ